MNATPESAAAFVLIVIALALGYVWHLCHVAPEMTARQEAADRARVAAMRAAQLQARVAHLTVVDASAAVLVAEAEDHLREVAERG